MPQTPLEMLSKVKVSDLQGLQAVISIVIQGSVNLSKPEDLANLVKQKAPGISDSIVSVLAKASNYMKQFGDPATQKFGQTVCSLPFLLVGTRVISFFFAGLPAECFVEGIAQSPVGCKPAWIAEDCGCSEAVVPEFRSRT